MLGTLTPSGFQYELLNDPALLGYAPYISGHNDIGVLNLLTAQNYTTYQPLKAPALILWGAGNGVKARIEDGANNIGLSGLTPPNDLLVRSMCQSVSYCLSGAASLDMTNPSVTGQSQMLDILASVGILVELDGSSAKPSLMTTAQVPCSRMDILGGYGTTPSLSDISYALRGNK